MDSLAPLVVGLSEAGGTDPDLVGGKAAVVGRLSEAGFRVPPGFALTFAAYEIFIREAGLEGSIRVELGRKKLEAMRWEELWDAALRIRSQFLSASIPDVVRDALTTALDRIEGPVAVRSSAAGEDSGGRSFAGLHESVTDVTGVAEVERAVRLVWASLWSDAALLYRRELGLDPASSRMAVLVQEMVHADRSGVAFGADPRGIARDRAIVEAVAGPCRLLVDGAVDPDRWEIDRGSGAVVRWQPGEGNPDPSSAPEPLLGSAELTQIVESVDRIESLMDFAPDVEWTGRASDLTVLQARPITTAAPDSEVETERQRYLNLRPRDASLRALRVRVVDELIPRLEAECETLEEEELEDLDDERLAKSIERRSSSLAKWKKVYWDEFIPFAHGVRRLATYYNDAVGPDDSYEFVGLLERQPLVATRRNEALRGLVATLRANESLLLATEAALEEGTAGSDAARHMDELRAQPGGDAFFRSFDDVRTRFFDITYDGARLRDAPELLLRNLVELSRRRGDSSTAKVREVSSEELTERLFAAVGEARREEAAEMIALGRASWRLRDDDNILIARLESQLLRATALGATRLIHQRRMARHREPCPEDAGVVLGALRDPEAAPISLPERKQQQDAVEARRPGESPRQLIGQPASPGVASGPLRVIRCKEDLGRFRQGEVLVCDAIEPTMTHLAMLAAAVVERRGGMLIHGAIIARELGIPSVNGVQNATELLRDGDFVTVDGYLGLVILGAPDLDLELRSSNHAAS